MMSTMRTTLTIEDSIGRDLKRIAFETGRSFKQVVNDTLRRGLEARVSAPEPRRFRLKPVSLGGPRPGVNLEKALQLAEVLEDQEISRKLELRK
jgi:hypothetical protein